LKIKESNDRELAVAFKHMLREVQSVVDVIFENEELSEAFMNAF
jgi:hypothetical protein